MSITMNRRKASVAGALAMTASLISSLLLTTAIVFAANPSADLDQCANDPAPSSDSNGCATSANQWVNGNVGASKAVYLEGDSLPYRMRFGSLALSSHTVTIEWDTTKSSKHALDYLTTFNRTVADANPCLGVASCNPATFTTFAIPVDSQVSGGGVTQVPGNFQMYGGTITAVSAYSGGGAFPTGDNSRRITLTFTPTRANPVLAWAAHISTRLDWGNANSSIAIPGSPFHTRLIDLDGSGGNQDRSLSNDAVVFPAKITITKHSNNPDSTSFPFTAGPSPLSNFNLVDNSASGDTSKVFDITDPANFKTYTVTEGSVTGWTLSNLSCTDVSQTGGTATTSGSTATINLKEGDNVTCTYTNSAIAPKLRLVKSVTNDDGGAKAAADWTLTATGTSGTFSDTGDSTTHHSVSAGVQYTLTESSVAGYSQVGDWSCSGGGTFATPNKITLALGDDVTCTVTNNDVAPKLQLVKSVTNDNGGSKTAADWTLTATGSGGFSDSGDSTTHHKVTAAIEYTLSESSVAGYTQIGDWSCNGGSFAAPNKITLGLGDDVTCTITNDDNGPKLQLVKSVTNDNGGSKTAADWTLTATGSGGFSDSGDSSTHHGVTAGVQYTLSESTVTGYDQVGDWSCTGGTFVAPNKITLVLGDDVTCTVANDDQKNTPTGGTTMGWKVNDSASFAIRAGASDASTATITFKLYSDADGVKDDDTCTAANQVGSASTVTVTLSNGDATASGDSADFTVGTGHYFWVATYSGDAYNNSASTACGSEVTTIQ
jgi:hypothetical protein